MADRYNPRDWFWQVGVDNTRLFSSKTGQVVPSTDATFTAWEERGNLPSRIGSYQDLYEVLLSQAPDLLPLASTSLENGNLRPDQLVNLRLETGLELTRLANTQLNGNYSVTSDQQRFIIGVAARIAAGKGLPHGALTVNLPDISGQLHSFTSDEFLAFAEAVNDYVYDLYMTANALMHGREAQWPSKSQNF